MGADKDEAVIFGGRQSGDDEGPGAGLSEFGHGLLYRQLCPGVHRTGALPSAGSGIQVEEHCALVCQVK